MTQLLLFFTLATILNIPDKYTDFWRILRTNFQNVTFWGKIRCFYLCMLSFTWLFAWENKWECRTWFLFWEDLKFMSDNRRLLNCHRRWYSHSVQWVCTCRPVTVWFVNFKKLFLLIFVGLWKLECLNDVIFNLATMFFIFFHKLPQFVW